MTVLEQPIPLLAGDRFLTKSGRITLPFPQTRARNADTKIREWLKDEAITEAKSLRDDFNTTSFKCLDPNNWSQADGDGVNEYLFGDPEGRIGERKVKLNALPEGFEVYTTAEGFQYLVGVG